MSMITIPTPSNLEQLFRHPLPTMYDLPSENPEEPGLPDEFHAFQAILLLLTFYPLNWDPEMVFSMMDHNIYYDANHHLWYKRPDWFGVVGVPRRHQGRDMRLSYVMWEEKVSPLIVVEFLSPGTEDEDLGRTSSTPGRPPTKWQVYEQILQVPYYVIFDRYTEELKIFKLVNKRYQMVAINPGRFFIPEIQLSLGLWEGEYMGHDQLWLRWMTQSGELITPRMDAATAALIERIKQEKSLAFQRAAEALQRAAEAQRLAEAAEQEKAAALQRAEDAESEKAAAQQRAEAAESEKVAALQRAAQTEQQIEELKALLRERGFDPDRQA